MYTRDTDDGISQQFDPKDLTKIQFPIFQENTHSAFFVNSGCDTIVFKYALKAKNNETAILSGKMIFPKNIKNTEVKTQFSMDILADSLILAIKQNIGLEKIPAIKTRIDALAKAIYEQFMERATECIVLNKIYELPAFIVMNQEIIGIGNKTIFKIDKQAGILNVELAQVVGSYLSKINASKKQVHLIIFNSEGNPLISMFAKVHNVYNTRLTASGSLVKFRRTSAIETCRKILKKYNKNYTEYFIKQEGDIFEDFSIF